MRTDYIPARRTIGSPGVASPDTVETRFGTLNFFDGVPGQTSTG